MADIALGSANNRQLCFVCTEAKKSILAEVYCIECAEFMCLACSQLIHKVKKFRSHFTITINRQIENGTQLLQVLENYLSCTEHPKKLISSFCGQHRALCCVTCVLQNHKSCHDVAELQDQESEETDHANKIKDQIYILHEEIKEIQEYKKNAIENKKQMVQEVCGQIKEMRRKVNSVFDSVEVNVSSEATTLIKEYIFSAEKAIMGLEKLRKSLELHTLIMEKVQNEGTKTHEYILTQRLRSDIQHIRNTVCEMRVSEDFELKLKPSGILNEMTKLNSTEAHTLASVKMLSTFTPAPSFPVEKEICNEENNQSGETTEIEIKAGQERQRDKNERQRRNGKKKIDHFAEQTFQKAKILHKLVIDKEFEETDTIKKNLEARCQGDNLLYSIFLSGIIINRCVSCLQAVKEEGRKPCATELTDVSIQTEKAMDEEAEKKPLHGSINNAGETNNQKTVTGSYRVCKQTEAEKNIDGNASQYMYSQEEVLYWLIQSYRKCHPGAKELEALSLVDLASGLSENISIVLRRHENETDMIKDRLWNVLQNCTFCHQVPKDAPLDEIIENVTILTTKLQKMMEEVKNRADKLNMQICMLQREKEDLLNRLSQYTCAQLTHSSLNTAELSDANRPTKLAEQFSELYDNQWADAFAVLKEKLSFSEKYAVGCLLFVLNQAYEFCLNYSNIQERIIMNALGGELCLEPPADFQTNEREKKIISDLRKNAEESSIKPLQTKFFKHLRSCVSLFNFEDQKLKKYVNGCSQLCWNMVLQSPQIYLESTFKGKESFDSTKYTFYKTQGANYKYIVWPVIYLHENGPVLTKGVAEAE